MSKNIKKTIRFAIALLIMIATIYYVTRDIDFQKLWKYISNANYWWVLLSVPAMILSHIVRAYRWKTLLKPVHKAKSIMNLFSAVMIGYAVNSIIPRGGELVRPYVYSRRENISKSASFATILVERFIDVLTLLLFFAVAFFMFRQEIARAFPFITAESLTYYVIAPVLALLAFILMSLYTNIGEFLLRKIVKPFSTPLYERLSGILVSFLKGLEIIKTPSQYLRLAFESVLIWIFYTLPMYLIFFSFDFQTKLNLTFADAFLLIIVVGIGVTLATTPGALGIYHTLLRDAMVALYLINKEEALAYATITHAANYLLQFLLGGFFFLRENIKKIPTEKDIPEGVMKEKPFDGQSGANQT
ncbi:MAG: lysylphosphatidylglycerol synthase transmembrane domain-containing protein [Candidatus Kapaibacterium sp.]